MNLPFFIAKRYFFAKKSHNIINIITGISMLGVGVGAMALIVVLSAFNGLETLVGNMYSSFQPDIRIEPATGKVFSIKDLPSDAIEAVDGVQYVSPSLEETVLLKYKDAQYFATIKGVENDFLRMSQLDSMMYDGQLLLENEGNNYVVLGYGVADQLNVFLNHVFEPVKVYAAKRSAKLSTRPEDAFNTNLIYPSGIFAINPEFDYQYILVPFQFAANILNYNQQASSYEVGVYPNKDAESIAETLRSKLGKEYEVKTRFQLNELLYKTNKTEKWITFLILTFILSIASFNMLGSLTVLILEKRKDIKTLSAMGLNQKMIRKTFLYEGFLISIIGGGCGIVLGVVLCLLQQHVGLLKLQDGGVAPYYPIEMNVIDILSVTMIVGLIGYIAAWVPTKWLFSGNKLRIV